MEFTKRVKQQKRRIKKLKKLNEILYFYLQINKLKEVSKTQKRIDHLITLI